jgi:hypothetical protein
VPCSWWQCGQRPGRRRVTGSIKSPTASPNSAHSPAGGNPGRQHCGFFLFTCQRTRWGKPRRSAAGLPALWPCRRLAPRPGRREAPDAGAGEGLIRHLRRAPRHEETIAITLLRRRGAAAKARVSSHPRLYWAITHPSRAITHGAIFSAAIHAFLRSVHCSTESKGSPTLPSPSPGEGGSDRRSGVG